MDLTLYFGSQIQNLVFVVEAIAMLWLGKQLMDKYWGSQASLLNDASRQSYDDGGVMHPEPDDYSADFEIEIKENLAVGLRRGGFYLGVLIGLFGTLLGPTTNIVTDAILFPLWGAMLLGFLFLSSIINDKLIVTGVNNTDEVRSDGGSGTGQGNVAIGLVEASGFIATGIIGFGALSGESTDLITGVIGSVAAFGLGQLALVLLTKVYEMFTKFNANAEIKDGNVAAGGMLGSWMIALSIVIANSLAASSEGFVDQILSVGLDLGWTLAVLYAATHVIDRLFLPNTNFHDEIERDRNTSATAMAGLLKIGVALIMAAAFI